MNEKQSIEKKNISLVGVVITVVVVTAIVGLLAYIGSGVSDSNSIAAGCSNPNIKQQAQAVNYQQLEKDPGSFDGTVAQFTGQVLQIQQSGNQGVIRLAVDQLFGSIWNPSDVVYITYQGNTNAVQGDVVTVYGPLTGSQTYTSQANFNITIPSMTGCVIQETSSSPSTSEISSSTPAETTPPQSQLQTPTPIKQSAVTQKTASPAPQASTPSPTPKTWHMVTTFTTATTENTSPFTVQGTEWKAVWSCQATLSVNTTPSVYAESIDGMGGGGGVVAEPNNCPSGNTTYFYSGPGTYYLQIDIYDPATMTITIEDYY